MKKLYLLLFIFSFTTFIHAQDTQYLPPVNGVKLHSNIEQYKDEMYLLTGEESVYKKYNWLRISLLRNIEKGIREGIYEGAVHDKINDVKATEMRLNFYKGELYMVRWKFERESDDYAKEIYEKLDAYLTEKYGNPNNQDIGKVWMKGNHRLQSFLDTKEFQIEYRDDKLYQELMNVE